MSSGIFYNQSVTANDLNEIATDLGATSFNGFGTEKFGASELNNITKDLVGKGYLNVKNKCKPTVSADGSKIIVQSGIVVFENGAKKVIENTLEISFGVGRKYYFLNEISNGLCSLWWSTVGYPSEGDYVPLCEVTSDGTLIDKRVFSVAKVNLGTAERNKTETVTAGGFIGKRYEWSYAGTIPLNFNGYNVVYMPGAEGERYGSPWQVISDTYVENPSSYTYFDYTRIHFVRAADGVAVYTYGNSSNGNTSISNTEFIFY